MAQYPASCGKNFRQSIRQLAERNRGRQQCVEPRIIEKCDGGGETVLVVEDEAAVRRMSVEGLHELGYRVVAAESAATALQALDRHPNIALLFTDVVMPEVNGAKLAEEARRRCPALKVLFTTGYTGNAVIHNGVLDPDVQVIGKPFTLQQLAAKLKLVLGR